MTRPHEIRGAAIAIGKSTHGVGALFGRNPGGQAVAAIDRHSESRAQRRSIERHHRIEMQPARFLQGKRRANDARRVADDECHLFGRAQACGDKQVALALAIVVIGDDDKLAARERTYRRADALLSVVHIFVFAPRRAVSAPVAQTATPLMCQFLEAVESWPSLFAAHSRRLAPQTEQSNCAPPK